MSVVLSSMTFPSFVPFCKTKPAWQVPKGVGNLEKKKKGVVLYPPPPLPLFFAPTKQTM